MSSQHTPRRDDKGIVAIEFLLVAPLLLMLLFGILSVGFYVSARMQAANTARENARTAALACTPGTTPTFVTGTDTKTYQWIVPLLPSPGGSVTETVQMRCGG
jgi:Flp pilus assembly protein TadG